MNLYNGDCLEILPTFPPASVEAIITDLPYGTTACEWDSIIPLDEMWKQVKRVLKGNGSFITTSSQPFTTTLINSNLDHFKYEMIWEKSGASGFVHAKNKPLKAHENIIVFSYGVTVHESQSKNRMVFNPQMESGVPYKKRQRSLGQNHLHKPSTKNFSFIGQTSESDGERYPRSVVYFSNPHGVNTFHTSEKPVNLYEYLIRTYTNAGETVLDICMGSGTTGVAAVQTGRNFIGIEKEQKYFEIASRRIAQAPQPLFTEPPRQPTQREPDKGNVTLNFEGFE